jgi:hypothetical protein
MRRVQDLFGFEGAVEISSKMQQPTALRPNLASDEIDWGVLSVCSCSSGEKFACFSKIL